ncbi:MAG TPA: UdgX family uracil-DNA binding protein [Casimicrobiaceae bacterium]|nr:UdgX family uracil-DNA binding protein [Casimicrobiaceae bacterium]
MARKLHESGSRTPHTAVTMTKKEPVTNRFRGTTLAGLRKEIDRCRACPLWERATQAVPGEGDTHARVMLVGEQPGDREDRVGRPFVGPAGGLLDQALEKAGIDRGEVFVTNAVKHFSWFPRGKRRMHKTPSQSEVAACLDWLEAEISLVRPKVIVCLGATAAKALLGRDFRVTRERGRLIEGAMAPFVLATVHPSSILRITDETERDAAFERFVADLAVIRRGLEVLRR